MSPEDFARYSAREAGYRADIDALEWRLRASTQQCRATIPADVLGIPVSPCQLMRGHGGEHASKTCPFGDVVLWGEEERWSEKR